MLYLLPDGSRVNRLLLGGWLSFSILWALCRRLTLPISLMRCRWVPMMFWVVLFTGWTWLVSVWYLCDICEPSNLNLFPAPRQLHWCRQECVPLPPFLQINRWSAPWFCWCYASLLFKHFQKYIIWKYVNTFNVANYVFFYWNTKKQCSFLVLLWLHLFFSATFTEIHFQKWSFLPVCQHFTELNMPPFLTNWYYLVLKHHWICLCLHLFVACRANIRMCTMCLSILIHR